MADVRSFVAISLSGPGRVAVEGLLARLQRDGAGVAWTRPANLHVTLKFLGGVSPDRLDGLRSSLAVVAAAQAPFTIAVRGTGAFPSLARPRAFWVGVEAATLAPLAGAVDAACVSQGFEPAARPFRPHVTLGRVRRSAGKLPASLREALAAERETSFGDAPGEILTLFRSDLGSSGATHTPLASWPLAGASD